MGGRGGRSGSDADHHGLVQSDRLAGHLSARLLAVDAGAWADGGSRFGTVFVKEGFGFCERFEVGGFGPSKLEERTSKWISGRCASHFLFMTDMSYVFCAFLAVHLMPKQTDP